jgi:hypothetical protein
VVLECADHGKAWFDNVSVYPRPSTSAEKEEVVEPVYPEGYVYDADTKRAVAGAEVTVDPVSALSKGFGTRPETVTTDSRGHFEFGGDGVWFKTSHLVVWHPEYGRRYFPFDTANPRGLELFLERPLRAVLKGTLYVNEVPFSGPITAHVWGSGENREEDFQGGTYSFHVNHGKVKLSVRAESVPRPDTVTLYVREGEEVIQDFHVFVPEDYKPEVYLSGTVHDAETGAPVRGAYVALDTGLSRGVCVSDEQGRFRTSEQIVREAPEVDVFVRCQGYLDTAAKVDISDDLQGDIEDVQLWLVAR